MAIDPNIALQVGQGVAPVNPLGMATQAQGLMNAQAQNRLTNTAIDTNQQALASKQQTALGVAAMSVLHLPDDQIVHGLHDTLDRLVANGVVPATMAQGWIDNVAKVKADTPAEGARITRQMIAQVGLQAMDPAGQFSQLFGANRDMSNGQAVQPGRANSPFMQQMTGAPAFVPSGAPVQQYPSRSELIGRVPTGVGPNGQPLQGPLATVTPQGLGGPAVAAMGSGRYNVPAALQNPAASPVGGANGQVSTGLGPAQQAAQATTGTTAANNFNDIAQTGVAARGRDAMMATMQTDLDKFIPGPGADAVKNVKAALSTVAQRLNMPDLGIIDKDKMGAQEAFNKFVAQLQNAQGAGSDARLAVVQAGTPSVHLTKSGLTQIFAQLRGNEQYNIARAQLAAQYPDKSDSQGFEASVAKNLDPRAFQFAQVDPSQRKAFLESFKPTDRDAIKRGYLFAQQRGLINGGQ